MKSVDAVPFPAGDICEYFMINKIPFFALCMSIPQKEQDCAS
jgi:hypothetical protein